MVKRINLAIFCLFSLAFIATSESSVCAEVVQAQANDNNWSRPIDLAIGREDRSLFPTLIADDAGGLHVFWDEIKEVPGGTEIMVVYAYWDGTSWSESVDVFVGERGRMALGASGDFDDMGYLHTVWIDELGLMYGARHVSSPVASSSWDDRQRIITEPGGNVHMPVLMIDDEGILHVAVLITGNSPGIYYLNSIDGGKTWELPRQISHPDVTEWRQGRLRYQLDLLPIDDVVHVVWQGVDQDGKGSIIYSRGFEAGQNWSVPISVQEDGSWPKLARLNNRDLILTSVGPDANERTCMKRQSISADFGETWSPMEIVFDPVMGCLGNAQIAADGDGNVHLIMSAYDSAPIVERIWHAVWDGGKWENPEVLSWTGVSYADQDLGTQPDFPSMAITGGDQLHAVFMTDEGKIWHTSKQLDASSVPLNTYPPLENEFVQVITTFESQESPKIENEDDDRQSYDFVKSSEFEIKTTADSTPLNPFVIGLIAAVLLISIVVLLTLRRGQTRK